jgi:hypothetical protein
VVPRWECHHHADREARWRETAGRLPAWGVVFGVPERTKEDGYRVAVDGPVGIDDPSG